MGPSPSKFPEDQIENISKNLLINLAFPKVSQRFQKAEFFYKTKQMKIHLPVENEKVIKQLKQNIKHIHAHEIIDCILIPKSYDFQKKGYCGSAGICKMIYDYFPYSLEGQIQNRKKSIDNQEFTELQVWKLMYVLLKACNFMHTNWRKVGDIRPKNIFYNQQRQLRVSCQYSYPKELTNYEKMIFEKANSYLSPQQIQDLKMGRIYEDKSRNAKQKIIQSESFSVGLTLLHVMLLFNCERIYDPNDTEINLSLLSEKIEDLQNSQRYSLVLKNITKGLLETFPERRLLTSELFDTYLKPYHKNMESMQSFNGSKLNFEINELMQKRATNSLIGSVWEACKTGLIESMVFHSNDRRIGMQSIPVSRVLEEQRDPKEKAFIEEIDKYSEIPRSSQVSRKDSIRLGGSRHKEAKPMTSVQRRESHISNESFHTVNSLSTNKKGYLTGTNPNRISNYSIQNRFGGMQQRIATHGDHNSPNRAGNSDQISDKFMTPLDQSSIFHTIQGEKSFDFNSLNLKSSRFKRSQTLIDPGNIQKDGIKQAEQNFSKRNSVEDFNNNILGQELFSAANFKKEKSQPKNSDI